MRRTVLTKQSGSGKAAKKRSLLVTNEPFELIFNSNLATQIIILRYPKQKALRYMGQQTQHFSVHRPESARRLTTSDNLFPVLKSGAMGIFVRTNGSTRTSQSCRRIVKPGLTALACTDRSKS